MAAFFCLLAGAVVAGSCVVLGHFHTIGWEKLAHGKGHIAEQSAGILLIVGARSLISRIWEGLRFV